MPAIRIDAADGAFDAHLERPETPNGHGLVLLQEIFGVTDKIRAYCRLFATQGYTVISPDLFWRMEPRVELPYSREGTLRAFEFLKRLDEDKAAADIAGCAAYLRRAAGLGGRIAVLGFCLGGKLAARASTTDAFAAAVAFYGVGIDKFAPALAAASCPLQLHFASRDRFVPEEARAAIASALAGRGNVEMHLYDTDHAFFRAELDDAASAASFERTVRFLRQAGLAHADAG
jgi:carboxymethylenebutenolidase